MLIFIAQAQLKHDGSRDSWFDMCEVQSNIIKLTTVEPNQPTKMRQPSTIN